MRVEPVEEGFNDFARVFELLVFEYFKVYGLILPVLCEELIVNAEEAVNLLEGPTNQTSDVTRM